MWRSVDSDPIRLANTSTDQVVWMCNHQMALKIKERKNKRELWISCCWFKVSAGPDPIVVESNTLRNPLEMEEKKRNVRSCSCIISNLDGLISFLQYFDNKRKKKGKRLGESWKATK